jgi:hypothetical protein
MVDFITHCLNCVVLLGILFVEWHSSATVASGIQKRIREPRREVERAGSQVGWFGRGRILIPFYAAFRPPLRLPRQKAHGYTFGLAIIAAALSGAAARRTGDRIVAGPRMPQP